MYIIIIIKKLLKNFLREVTTSVLFGGTLVALGREGFGSKTYQMILRFKKQGYICLVVITHKFSSITDCDASVVCLLGQSNATQPTVSRW